ncbi:MULTISPECIES: porin [Pseudomonadaceae]|uniref:porin n=1 Tax=Pseudomonadaceae TaxID=135621 RepID=UPI0010405A4A|nr:MULTISPECIES: porin [Pseudomonadaceae]MBA1278157.1 porin [Stutzerimonas stutzeri]MBC8650326.1 porin [Pseudomonas sp. MT4]QXY93640.1 porin [Pseudomonas sp. MTM4]TCD20063.1 porin [Pseudomonas sp. IC_126]
MKKKLIAIAVGAAMAVPAVAMADISIYGRAHVSVDFLDDGADYSETNLSSNSSRLGFKGDHQINPNLNAFFQIEQEVLFGSDNGSSFNTRDTFVGLSGNFGAAQIGRFDSPFKVARGPANLFGDQVGDMRNLTRVGDARFDERYDNTIQYTTPDFGGFNAKLAYSVHEGQSVQLDDEGDALDSDSMSMSLNYAGGPLEASLAYEQAEEDTSRGERDGIRAAAAYKLTDAFKLVGFYQTIEYDDADASDLERDLWTSDVYGVGGEYKIASNTALKAMWMTRDADADDADADMWVVGVEHKLDKAVRVYANYAVLDNDDAIRMNPWSQGRSANPSSSDDAFGEQASAFTVGLRYDF